MADTVIENLVTRLSFLTDDKALEKFDQFLGSAVKGLTAIVAGATVAGTAVALFTKKIAESNDELVKFAKRTGIDTSALQELGYVAELNGGSIDSMNSSLESLSRIASEASRGMGAGVEVFGMLGISVTDANGRVREADDLLNDVSDSISRLGTQAERLEFAGKLGISGDLLLTIQQGSEAIRQQREEARSLSILLDKDMGDAAEGLVDNLLRMNTVIKGISTLIATRFMKITESAFKNFFEWYKINKQIIAQRIDRTMDVITRSITGLYNVGRRVFGIITSLVTGLGGLKNTIIAVTGVLVAMNASALLMPILITAVAAGILLLLEDIIKFSEGGESAVGELAKKYKGFDTLLRGTLDVLEMIVWGWQQIFENGDKALEGMILLAKDLGEAIQQYAVDKLNDLIRLINKVPGIEIGTISTQRDIQEQRRQSILKQSAEKRASITNNNNPNVSININGGDTEKVKQAVKDVLSEQYSGAQSNLQSQVDY